MPTFTPWMSPFIRNVWSGNVSFKTWKQKQPKHKSGHMKNNLTYHQKIKFQIDCFQYWIIRTVESDGTIILCLSMRMTAINLICLCILNNSYSSHEHYQHTKCRDNQPMSLHGVQLLQCYKVKVEVLIK